MKKLVALAVAGAFVAPVYAADVSVSGELEFQYISTAAVGTTADTNALSTADSVVVVTATEEINGIKFTGTVVMDQDAATQAAGDGSTLTMAFSNGFKLGLGEQAGAADAMGDYTDVSPVLGGRTDGTDHGVVLTFPATAGITAVVSHSPEDGTADGTTAAKDAFGVKYGFAGGELYYASEDTGGSSPTTFSTYGVKYSASGFMVAYETSTTSAPGVNDLGGNSMALTYKMGDILFGLESNKIKRDGATVSTTDNTVMFAEYNLGSSVDVYIANESSEVSTTGDRFAIGVEYVF